MYVTCMWVVACAGCSALLYKRFALVDFEATVTHSEIRVPVTPFPCPSGDGIAASRSASNKLANIYALHSCTACDSRITTRNT
jgi:hypothetical protein